MSQNATTQTQDETCETDGGDGSPRALTEDEREMYRSPVGAESPEIDVADEHPTKDAYENDDGGWQIDPRTGIQRFVELYEEYAAFVREDLANGETACFRRAKHELKQVGYTEADFEDMSFGEVIELAKEETGYEPVIEIVYTKGEKPQYEIHDNGCGISVKEWGIFKEIGLSASHFDGDRLGKFGMGWLAKFKGSGYDNPVLAWTKSVFDEASYSHAITVGDPEGYLPGDRDSYGTTFKFTLCDEAAENIDMRSAVEEYAGNLRVPVRYEERDESGKELYNDDFPPKSLEESYGDDAPYLTYEDPNGMFRIVASTEASYDALLISVGIDIPYAKQKKYNSPWKWDLRVNYEDGRIYESEIDEHIGKIPVSEQAYDRLPDEKKDNRIIKEEMHESDKRLPEPTGSRDHFERHRLDDFLEHATEKIDERFAEMAEDVVDGVTTLDDVLSLDPSEELIFEKALEQALHYTTEGRGIQEKVENYVGVTLPEELCEKIKRMRTEQVGLGPRGTYGIRKAENREATSLKEVLKMAGSEGTVYMCQTISQWKAELVWAAHEDNQVVRVNSAEYDSYAETFGWKTLTSIPNKRSIEDIVDYFDGALDEAQVKRITDYDSTSTSSGRDPATRRIKVRYKSGGKGYHTYKPETIKERFENDKRIKVGRYSTRVSNLVLFPTTEDRRVSSHYWMAGDDQDIGVAKCPKYVYEYLIDVDNVYSYEQMVEEQHDKTIETSSGEVAIKDLTSDNLVVTVSEDVYDFVGDNLDELKSYLDEESDAVRITDDMDVSIVQPSFFDDCWLAFRDAQGSDGPEVLKFDGSRPDHIRYTSSYDADVFGLYKYIHLGDVPEDAPEMEILDQIDAYKEETRALVDSLALAHNSGGLASQR